MSKRAQDAIVDFLRDNLTDHNSTNRVGSQWIYPDTPLTENPNKNSFPRIGVEVLGMIPQWSGSSSTDFVENYRFDVTVYVVADLEITISAEVYVGADLAEFVASDVKNAIRLLWRTDSNTNAVFTHVKINDYGPLGFELSDRQKRIFRFNLEVEAVGFSLGEGAQ